MDSVERKQFVSGYTKVLTNAWTDEDFLPRLKENPNQVLAEQTIELPSDATVEISTDTTGEPNLEKQVELWDQGTQTGKYTLYVPEAPQVDVAELGIQPGPSGAPPGACPVPRPRPDPDGTVYCCCCCPCCTCT